MLNIIINILTVSLSMSVLAMLLILLSKPMKHFRASCRYFLWLLVIVRLMLPVGGVLLPKLFTVTVPGEKAETTLTAESVSSTATAEDIEIPDPVYSSRGFTTSALQETDEAVRSKAPEEGVSSEKEENTTSDLKHSPTVTEDGIALAALMLWFGGAGVFLTVSLSSYKRNIHIIKRNLRNADWNTQRIYREVCSAMNVRKAPRLYVCSSVRSPMVCGLFRTRVLLPEISLTESDIRRVLSHEIIHYKRHDLVIKFVALVANAIHWFNPMAYIVSKRLFAEMELSCDERVLKNADKEERIFYGVAMLEIVKKCRRGAPSLTTGFNPQRKAVTQRFENILDTAKKRRGYSVVALILCVCVLCTSVVGFADDSQERVCEPIVVAVNTTEEAGYEVLFTYKGDVEDIQPFYDMMDDSMDPLGVSLLVSENGEYLVDYDGNIRAQLPESEFGFTYCSVCNKITDHNYYIDPISFEVIYEPAGHGGGSGHYVYDGEDDLILYAELGGYRICDEVDFAVASLSSPEASEGMIMTERDIFVDEAEEFLYTDDGVVFFGDNYISYDETYYNESGGFGLICNSEPVTDFEHEGYLDFDNYGICALKKNGKWGYFNHKGEMILDYLYEDSANWVVGDHAQQVPYSSSSGVIALKRDGLWAYADTEGNMITDFVFEEARPASLGRAWVKLQGEWCVIAFSNYVSTLSPGEAALLVKPFMENYYRGEDNVEIRIVYDSEQADYYGIRCYIFNVSVMNSRELYTVSVSHDKAVYLVAPNYSDDVEIG